MSELFQGWLRLSLPWRLGGLALLALILLIAGWLMLLRPQYQAREAQLRRLADIAQQQQQRRQQLDARPAIAALQDEIARLQQPAIANSTAASLESVIATRGSLLEAWHPDSQPQQLALQLSWPQFVPLFTALATTALPVPQRFQLQAEPHGLRTQFWLERDDAE